MIFNSERLGRKNNNNNKKMKEHSHSHSFPLLGGRTKRCKVSMVVTAFGQKTAIVTNSTKKKT